jgi:hypothetical protein
MNEGRLFQATAPATGDAPSSYCKESSSWNDETSVSADWIPKTRPRAGNAKKVIQTLGSSAMKCTDH